MKSFKEWQNEMYEERTEITVRVILTGQFVDDTKTWHEDYKYQLQQDFLNHLPEKLGKATVYHAEIMTGGVDKDGVNVYKN